MTPLAQMLVRHALKHGISEPVAGTLLAARCFEVTQVGELIDDLVRSKFDPAAERITSFLPAPVTWIERKYDWGRHGALLHSAKLLPDAKITSILSELDDIDGIAIRQVWHNQTSGEFGSFPPVGVLFCDDENVAVPLECKRDDETDEECADRFDESAGWGRAIMAAVAVINSPRVIGRREHQPHVGLQRELGRQHNAGGKFPMECWTEIMLEVTPTAHGVGHDGVLTGKRALHFCRAHLRLRLGRVELVSSHWRGDPAIGLRRGRYTVVTHPHKEERTAV
jgi:hypothetical protein